MRPEKLNCQPFSSPCLKTPPQTILLLKEFYEKIPMYLKYSIRLNTAASIDDAR